MSKSYDELTEIVNEVLKLFEAAHASTHEGLTVLVTSLRMVLDLLRRNGESKEKVRNGIDKIKGGLDEILDREFKGAHNEMD